MRRKILVLVSEGGAAHITASAAIQEVLEPTNIVEIVNVIADIIHPLDLFHRVFKGRFTAEDLYNFMLCKGFHKGVNALVSLGSRYMLKKQEQIEHLFDRYLDMQGIYDLVISTVPFVNGGIARALMRHKIPFLIVPVTLDMRTFFLGMQSLFLQQEDRILCTFPYEDMDLRKKSLQEVSCLESRIVVAGFPVRLACQKRYTTKEIVSLKHRHGMDPSRMTLTLALGSAGDRMVMPYTERLATMPIGEFLSPLEINICVGRHEKTYQKLERYFRDKTLPVEYNTSYSSWALPNGLVFHIRRYVEHLTDIMACSQVIIAKTGSCIVNEAIYLGCKLLLDNTDSSLAGHLLWEHFTLHFVRKHGLGDVFHDLSEMTALLRIWIREGLSHPVLTGAFPLPDFTQNLRSVVSHLLQESS